MRQRLRHAWEHFRLRAEIRLEFFPVFRLVSAALAVAGAVALLVSGALAIDYPLRSFPGLLVGILFLGFAVIFWELE